MSGKIYRIPAAALADAIMRELEETAQLDTREAFGAPSTTPAATTLPDLDLSQLGISAEPIPSACACPNCTRNRMAEYFRAAESEGVSLTPRLRAAWAEAAGRAGDPLTVN